MELLNTLVDESDPDVSQELWTLQRVIYCGNRRAYLRSNISCRRRRRSVETASRNGCRYALASVIRPSGADEVNRSLVSFTTSENCCMFLAQSKQFSIHVQSYDADRALFRGQWDVVGVRSPIQRG